jgi:transposase
MSFMTTSIPVPLNGGAAFEVATGKLTASHCRRRRRIEFLDFMNQIVAAWPGKEIHVIVDNRSTHKPKLERWLARHPNVHFHFTPTYASWLNQVEVWFSTLQSRSLANISFTSVRQLRNHIDTFVASYNQPAVPIVWDQVRGSPEASQAGVSRICGSGY